MEVPRGVDTLVACLKWDCEQSLFTQSILNDGETGVLVCPRCERAALNTCDRPKKAKRRGRRVRQQENSGALCDLGG